MRKEILIVKVYINKILSKGFIKPSILLYTLLILVVKKLSRELRIYVNYK